METYSPSKKKSKKSSKSLSPINQEEKYIACLVLHALGDTIGFYNGKWEFNYHSDIILIDIADEILYEFIKLGGINQINLEGWYASDDTIYNIAISNSIIASKSKSHKILVNNVKTELALGHERIVSDEMNNIARSEGNTTGKYIEKFTQKRDASKMPYDSNSGGNGCAMRTSSIGLAYHGANNREQLCYLAIETSRITHNSAIGYLGGLTNAYFIALAIEGVPLEKWPYLLIELLESKLVLKYIKRDLDDTVQEELKDYNLFIFYWKKYIGLRFTDKQEIITSKANHNLVYRSKFHYDNFTINTPSFTIGDNGYSATIMAYDALIDAGNVWEKLIIYSAFHFGDSDTVSAIACSWYGALYGFAHVPENNLKYLEFKDELIKLGKTIYKSFI
jgi:ADP-ribosylarginine hydrolase